MKRRHFLQVLGTAAAAATTAHAWAVDDQTTKSANDTVRVGLIGCGTRGTDVGKLMQKVPGVEFVTVCDVYEANAAAAKQWTGEKSQIASDFRRVLDRKDVDAVLIATPDHWHATIAILACEAGKDVYVEKPLAHNVREGRAIVEAARKYKRVAQTGTQHRSAPHYREAAEIVKSGELGPIHFVRVWNYTNQYPQGMGQVDNTQPAGLDWDFYLGPAPAVPYDRHRFLGSFRVFYDYAGGLLTDFGTHRFDSVRQVMDADAPLTVSATGRRFELNDGRDTPDVLQVTYEFPNFVLSYESSYLNGQGTGGRTPGKKYYRARGPDDRPHGEAFYGTNGTLFSDRIGYEIYPELTAGPRDRDRDPGLPRKPPEPRMQRKEVVAVDTTDLHTQNFIECVRSRKTPNAEVEIGHKSTIIGHLGNISYRTGRKLRWDATKEVILDDPEANELLGRKARKPWDLIG